MLPPRIVVSEKPDAGLRESIARPLQELDFRQVGSPSIESFAVELRDPQSDATIGGLWATFAHRWMFVDLMFVPEIWRGRGLGATLLRRAEQEAEIRGCVGVRLETFSFQAPGFYARQGYEQYGVLRNYPPGHDHLFFYKVRSR